MTNDPGGVEMDFDEFDRSLAQAESELRWADALLDAVHELAFLPELAGYEDLFETPVLVDRTRLLLRLRRHPQGWRVHGYCDVLWDGQGGWLPSSSSAHQHPATLYPDLRRAVDQGVPAAMICHTKVVHQYLDVERLRLGKLPATREHGKDE